MERWHLTYWVLKANDKPFDYRPAAMADLIDRERYFEHCIPSVFETPPPDWRMA